MENWDIKRFARGLNANATGVLVLILLEAPTSAMEEEAKAQTQGDASTQGRRHGVIPPEGTKNGVAILGAHH